MPRKLALFFLFAAGCVAQPRFVELPDRSPLVTLRFVFTTGAASDPADKPGLASLTGSMLGSSGTQALTYKQVLDAMYPMAASVSVYSDKEMTTFVGETHVDNLDRFYTIMRDMVLHPGWRAEDLTRVRDRSINALRVGLRGNNDEELAKEELYNLIYAGQPYGHEDLGTVAALTKVTMADLQGFYRQNYTQANLIVGLAGGYSPEFLARVKKDFASLPAGKQNGFVFANPPAIAHNTATLIEKDTRSVAWSIGFPLDVKRGDPDFPALLVMQSWFGQHRIGGHLFERMRQVRGLNYGDYDYIEYFPGGMFTLEPQPNLARHQQIFQIWIRPVEPANAVFSLKLAMYELDRLVKGGMNQADFERTRSFVSKYVNVLTKSKSAELGYAIDSLYYGIPGYNEYIKTALRNLTLEDVNRAIRAHMRSTNVQIAGVAKDTAELEKLLKGTAPTPITYNSPKTQDVLDEDKIIEKLSLNIGEIHVIPVAQVFEN